MGSHCLNVVTSAFFRDYCVGIGGHGCFDHFIESFDQQSSYMDSESENVAGSNGDSGFGLV
jgi:hypothetical protein